MNSQLILDNYLMILKSTVEVYIHGTLESSNEDVRSTLKNNLKQILLSQEDTFNLMVKKGFYNIENINEKSIEKVLQNK